MLSELHLVWNPVAGNGAAVKAYEAVTRELATRGVPFESSKSEYPGHAVELAKQAMENGAKKIAAIGGDGTIREVASALLNTDVPLGIISCGTGNDIVRPLKIPNDPLQALEVVLSGEPRHMDAAMANDLLYFNVAGFGFDVDVLHYVEIYKKKMKNGSLAYLRGLISAIANLQSRKTKITWPGGSMEEDVLIIAAGNGTHFGGGMMVTPNADPFDGQLDICVMHGVKKRDALTLLPKFLKGNHVGTKFVTYFRTTELTAVCEPSSMLDVDGDVLPGTPVTFRILPQSLWVVVPQ
ncbi:MAG TPA: diacylglycerol kinase family lipid kinase [Eubacteriales bacterium]|nr:diacylglycerol kinase family lipid kinase [Eubacteriales bacterium]